MYFFQASSSRCGKSNCRASRWNFLRLQKWWVGVWAFFSWWKRTYRTRVLLWHLVDILASTQHLCLVLVYLHKRAPHCFLLEYSTDRFQWQRCWTKGPLTQVTPQTDQIIQHMDANSSIWRQKPWDVSLPGEPAWLELHTLDSFCCLFSACTTSSIWHQNQTRGAGKVWRFFKTSQGENSRVIEFQSWKMFSYIRPSCSVLAASRNRLVQESQARVPCRWAGTVRLIPRANTGSRRDGRIQLHRMSSRTQMGSSA